MLQYRDLKNVLRELGVKRSEPTIAHISAALIPHVKGGAQTVLGAVLASIDNILTPSFTYKTMLVPEVGPDDNLLEYGSGRLENLNASIYTPDLPADFEDCAISEVFRHYPDVKRSSHPMLSFVGLGLDAALNAQSATNPYAHTQYLRGKNASVLLAGKGPAALFALHLCEMESGRKQFVRWAMSEEGVKECLHYPGCSQGFHKIIFHLKDKVKQTLLNDQHWYAFSLDALIEVATRLLQEDPYALLCNDLHCVSCNLVRKDIRQKGM